VIFSNDFIANAHTKIEYGFITGDINVGNGEDFNPHKHDYEEIFLFWAPIQKTPQLGAEIEFWLGEGMNWKRWLSTPHPLYMCRPDWPIFRRYGKTCDDR